MSDLLHELQKHNININPEWNTDRYIKNDSQYFIGTKLESGLEFAAFGDFKTNVHEKWSSKAQTKLSEEEKIKLKEFTKKAIENKQKEQDEAALRAQKIWDEATENFEAGDHPYLVVKGLDKAYGARFFGLYIVIPLMDHNGKIHSLQKIDAFGTKTFLPGGKKKGCFFKIGTGDAKYLCEGFSTGCSIHAATGEPVIVAFDSGNLKTVSELFTNGHSLIVCADNDNHGTHNTGILAAQATGRPYIYPSFDAKFDAMKPTDFNDLHKLCGIDAVREEFYKYHERDGMKDSGSPEPEDKDQGAGASNSEELDEICASTVDEASFKFPSFLSAMGNQRKPTEVEMAEALVVELKKRNINLMVENKSIFYYTGTYWKEFGFREESKFKILLSLVARDALGDNQVQTAYSTFRRRLPSIPMGKSFFTPNPFLANFKNGTLHIVRENQEYSLQFEPHRMDNYLTNCIPFDYKENSDETNPVFLECLESVFKNDSDMAEKYRLYAQFLGACLVSAFPMTFLFVGKPGTGKSTLLLIATRLVSEENICSVDPSEFSGFNMETMVNKLVNYDTDIDTSKPLNDSVLKKVIDRPKMRIKRKNITDVYGYLPAIHAFGANEMPRTREGASGAMERRFRIIRTDSFQPKGDYDLSFHDHVWQSGPQGIINFAISGLRDLCRNKGHYVLPESSKHEMQEWRDSSDTVILFLSMIKKGEFEVIEDPSIQYQKTTVIVDLGGRIERKVLWNLFLIFASEEYSFALKVSKSRFYKKIHDAGFHLIKSDGVWFFQGLKKGI